MNSIVPLTPLESITVSILLGRDRGDPNLGPYLVSTCDTVRVMTIPGDDRDPPAWTRAPNVVQYPGCLGGVARAFTGLEAQGYHLVMSSSCLYPADYISTMVSKIERYGRKAIVGVRGGFRLFPRGFRLIPTDEPVARDLPVHELDPRMIGYHASTVVIPRGPLGPGGLYLGSVLGSLAQQLWIPLISVERKPGWIQDRENREVWPEDPEYPEVPQYSGDWRLFHAGGSK